MFPTLKRQLNLVDKKLATAKYNEDRSLVLFKYSRKVMYDNLWGKYPELYECRGHVYDTVSEDIVQAAPRKCFNLGENDWWSKISLNTKVQVHKKYNGFLANATMHNGKILVTTTGSFDSTFQVLAEQMIKEYLEDFQATSIITEDSTLSFEICHKSDPHIVTEKEGVYPLCWRQKNNGLVVPFYKNLIAEMHLSDVLTLAEQVSDMEGFMLYGLNDVCKVKTHTYIVKKKLMRMTDEKIDLMYDDPSYIKQSLPYPDLWFLIYQILMLDKDKWKNLTEQDRRAILDLALHTKGYKIE